mgnify:CR=1 FL=1
MKEQTVSAWNGWSAPFRFLTPVLVTISLWTLAAIGKDVKEVRDRIYEHQTNAELHVPRGEFERIRVEILQMRQEIVASIRQEQQRRMP